MSKPAPSRMRGVAPPPKKITSAWDPGACVLVNLKEWICCFKLFENTAKMAHFIIYIILVFFLQPKRRIVIFCNQNDVKYISGRI